MENSFYKSFINNIKTNQDRKFVKKQTISNLFKKPIRDRGDEEAHISAFEPNQIQQADVLFLPDDDGYKYLLVVVDD